jgi:hypothetical protein
VWGKEYFVDGAFSLNDLVGVMVVEGGEAVVEEGVVVFGLAEGVLFFLHLDDSIHDD